MKTDIETNNRLGSREQIRRAVVFVVVTFVLNYLMAFLFYGIVGDKHQKATLVMAVIYMFVPMIVAVILQKFIYRESVKSLGVSWKINKWWVVGWLLPPAIAFMTLGVSLLFPGIHYSPEMSGMVERFKNLVTPQQLAQIKQQINALPVHPIWLALIQGLIAGITVNAIAGFGEELGWRGYLQKYLGFLGFWRSSFLIGLIWGIWHMPLILHGHNYPQHPQLGVLMMTLWTLLLTPIFNYIRIRSNSVVAAAILHGSLNGTVGLAIMVIKGGNDLTTGITGMPGFIVLAVVNLLIFLYDRYGAMEKAGVTRE